MSTFRSSLAGTPNRLAGLVGIVGVALVVVLAMNAGRLPVVGQGGREVSARFADIGGLQTGDRVEMAGVDVGHVTDLALGRGYITVRFEVRRSLHLGDRTRAAIKVSNLLGSKYLEVTSGGDRDLGGTIPLDRTASPYDLTTAFENLTTKLEPIDTRALEQALTSMDDTFRNSGGDVRAALRGLSAVSRSVATRDAEITSLLRRSDTLTASLDRSRTDIASLLRSARLLLAELEHRRDAIHGLIVHTRDLAAELHGLVADNEREIGPALRALAAVTRQFEERQQALRATIRDVTKFARVFVNTIGGGPWFDSYLGNAPDTLKLEDPR
jgi:phospholipid/cholesterol/gamma-HCH transport system substrate-binding protein